MAVKAYLLDKSALARVEHPAVSAALLVYAGRLAITGTVLLELGWSATSMQHFQQIREDFSWYQTLDIEQETIDLACELQTGLVERGHHRGPGVADLVLAAAAIMHSAVLLHYDRDFELIAQVDGRLQHRWVVPQGSV